MAKTSINSTSIVNINQAGLKLVWKVGSVELVRPQVSVTDSTGLTAFSWTVTAEVSVDGINWSGLSPAVTGTVTNSSTSLLLAHTDLTVPFYRLRFSAGSATIAGPTSVLGSLDYPVWADITLHQRFETGSEPAVSTFGTLGSGGGEGEPE